jgi:hypothetical protein
VNLILSFEQEIRQVRSILARNTRNQSSFHLLSQPDGQCGPATMS